MFLLNNSAMYNVFVQGTGVLGIIASIISFQCKKHKNIMIFRTANEMLFAVQYFFLGAYTGVAMNVFGSLRNMVFMDMVKKDKNTMIMRYVFSGIFLLFIALTWEGSKSLLSGLAKVTSTFAYGSSNTRVVRIMILLTSTSWLIYNLIVGSYAGFLCELFTIVSIITAIIRIDLYNMIQGKKANKKMPAGTDNT